VSWLFRLWKVRLEALVQGGLLLGREILFLSAVEIRPAALESPKLRKVDETTGEPLSVSPPERAFRCLDSMRGIGLSRARSLAENIYIISTSKRRRGTRRQVMLISAFHSEHSGTMPLNSMSSHCCCSQRRIAAGITGQGFESPLSVLNHSILTASLQNQPAGSKSTVAPSKCFHLKAKYISLPFFTLGKRF
jgi:hypothetical protein